MKYNTKKTIKSYWNHSKKYKKSGIFLFASILIISVLDVIYPLYLKKFFDILTNGQPIQSSVTELMGVFYMLIFLYLLTWVFWRIGTFSIVHFQTRIIKDLYNTCFQYLHKHSYSFFQNNFVGSLVKKVNQYARSFENISERLAFDFTQLIVSLLFIIGILLYLKTIVGLILLGWLIIYLIVNWFVTKYKLKYDIQRSEAESASTAILADTITNSSNVKLFNGFEREVNNFNNANEKVRKLTSFTWIIDNLFEAMQTILMLVLEMGLIYVGIKLWQKGEFSVGDFVLLQSYLTIVFRKIWGFGRIIRRTYQDLANAEEMTEILNTPHDIKNAYNAHDLNVTKGEIDYKDVDFAYKKTRHVLTKFNLTIKPHEKVAFVGPSGAGKTTAIKLIMRMYDVSNGKIFIDGQNIRKVTLESLWKNVSLVPQDPILFHRTLMENIRYGKPEASEKEVVQAAKIAHCHEFIKNFSEKYNTYVGERGIKLSGGERQRVAIARAVLKNSPILILDEATSSLDSSSEGLIQDALNNLMKDKTVIVIAHRLSTIQKMDRIVVIDKGMIIEQGTHDVLVKKKKGHYKKLWELQAGGFINT